MERLFMKKFSLLLLSICFCLPNTLSALSLEYHHYYVEDGEDNVDIARMTVMGVDAQGLISLKMEGGIPAIDRDSGVVSLDYEATRPSNMEPSAGLLPFGLGFGLFEPSTNILYVLQYSVFDYRQYLPLSDQGLITQARIMVLVFDGTDFVLTHVYQTAYTSFYPDTANLWHVVQPRTPVKYRLIQ
jgi:hypothetical protein